MTSINGTSALPPIKSPGNQIYIELINSGHGVEEGFSASVLFGTSYFIVDSTYGIYYVVIWIVVILQKKIIFLSSWYL